LDFITVRLTRFTNLNFTIMNKFILLALLPFLLVTGCNVPGNNEALSGPESLGVSSQAVLDFIETAEKERSSDLHSFILMRHGQVAAQGWWDPYNPESPHMLFSLSKSFTSTAIGIAQAEGLLNINDPVISFFPDETPSEPSGNLQSMRIRDLLRMSTGHNEDATGRLWIDTVSWVLPEAVHTIVLSRLSISDTKLSSAMVANAAPSAIV